MNRIISRIVLAGLWFATLAAWAECGVLKLAVFCVDATPPVGSMMAYDRDMRIRPFRYTISQDGDLGFLDVKGAGAVAPHFRVTNISMVAGNREAVSYHSCLEP